MVRVVSQRGLAAGGTFDYGMALRVWMAGWWVGVPCGLNGVVALRRARTDRDLLHNGDVGDGCRQVQRGFCCGRNHPGAAS